MQSLASLFVTFVVVALVGAGESHARPAPSLDRHATIGAAIERAAAAPLSRDARLPGALAPSLHAPLVFAAFLPRAPLPAPRASLPLYLRHRALLL